MSSRKVFSSAALCVFLAPSARGWSCNDISSATNATLTLRSLETVDPLAVCNDGSAAGYYIEHGTDPDLWLIYLGGGSWCWDEASCAARYSDGCPQSYSSTDEKISCMSNESFVEECAKSGIFDRDASKNPALATATLVYVPYCTSDAHMGDVGASDETYGWHFRGARVVRAVVADLVATQGLSGGGGGSSSGSDGSKKTAGKEGEDAPTRVVFGGGSAGARGAMTLLDEVADLLAESSSAPAALSANTNNNNGNQNNHDHLDGKALRSGSGGGVEVVGFLDSPMIMDVAAYNDSFTGFAAQHQQVYALTNAQTVVPADCAALYAGADGAGAWRCIMGQYRLPLVHASLAAVAFQFDSYQLDDNIWAGDAPATFDPAVGLDDAQTRYVEAFAAVSRTLVGGLAATTGNLPLELSAYRSSRNPQKMKQQQKLPAAASSSLSSSSYSSASASSSSASPSLTPGSRAIFSPACWNHHQSENSAFWTLTAAAYAPWAEAFATMSTFLQLFLDDDDATDVWIDACTEVNCGAGC